MHAFVFEDQPWFPPRLRGYITDVLHVMHRAFCIDEIWTPRIAALMHETGETRIVDLCSGGGGPTLAIVQRLRQQHGLAASAQLTDLFPNRTALERINAAGLPGVRYLAQPVGATDVPEELAGVRTMFASFHHMPEAAARGILADAFHKRRALCVFEGTESYAIGLPLLTCAVTPFTLPRTLDRLLLTYALPLVPALVTWDGVASHRRTHAPAELRELTADLRAADYRWETGWLRHRLVPYRLPYLIGRPVARGRPGPPAPGGAAAALSDAGTGAVLGCPSRGRPGGGGRGGQGTH